MRPISTCVCLLLGMALACQAAVINFDDLALLLADYDPIPAGYGSTATISVSYRTLMPDYSPFSDQMRFWHDGYSDLRNVAFADAGNRVAEITLTAIGGASLVRLNSFDLGAFSVDRDATVMRILDGSGNVLADYAPLTVPYASHMRFTPDLAAPQLSIRWGIDWNVGIDNINVVSEGTGPGPVPEPAAWFLLASGLLGLPLVRRALARRS